LLGVAAGEAELNDQTLIRKGSLPGAPFMQAHRMSGQSRECAIRFAQGRPTLRLNEINNLHNKSLKNRSKTPCQAPKSHGRLDKPSKMNHLHAKNILAKSGI
jgi:hypothetical protein